MATKQKTLTQRVDAVLKSASKLQGELDGIMRETLIHAGQHGDCTLIERLINELPKSQRTNSIKAWFKRFGDGVVKVGFDKDTKTVTVNLDHGKLSDTEMETLAEVVKDAKPFWEEFGEERAPTVWELDTLMKFFDNKLDASLKACKATREEVYRELSKRMEQFVPVVEVAPEKPKRTRKTKPATA